MKTLLGQRIREQRRKKGWTMDKLAEKADLSVNYVGDLERGVKTPSLDAFIRIVEANESEITDIITKDNLFQYPTERMTVGMVRACYRRLNLLSSERLIRNVAEHPVEEAKQICLYAIMKDNRLVWDFMVTVIGEKYRNQDFSYGKLDLTSFFTRLQEQNEAIAGWSESTVKKLKSVLNRILRENDYLNDIKAGHLNPVWLYPELENVILTNGDQAVLPAFNRFE